ncbi:kinase-like domain-containing protein [Thamnocephalis sphaerospora]|uniref:Kinase-like domain-containing protein n=1 Tax=Thamnocephalis sphaerospora TaxID=78915 RepID=A0A4P9XRP6_9FUNG|nr:kinase-like domain-containing protein [Thamnocephalis sphaerospora]|eukprot:RKP08748.1 kinase-like domain-containing protein [Thamnocephalis sphaerospora]
MPPSYDSIFANSTQSTTDADWPNQPGIYIVKWHPEEGSGMRTAVVDYSNMNGLLKCTPHVNQHNNEVAALKRSRIRHTALSFVHKSGFIHGNITPDNVYFQSNKEESGVDLVLTGFEGSQVRESFPQASIIKPKGYAPPEDYVGSKADQRSRDAWMFGATLYFMTNGHPPYGFAYSKSHGAMLPVSAEELQQTMEQVAKTGKNSYLPIQARSGALLYEMESLLKPKPEHRSNANRIAIDDSLRFFRNTLVESSFWGLWGYLKSMLPIVGTPSWLVEPAPREQTEDRSTRYKIP